MKITFFELMCLWHIGKKPKTVVYEDELYEKDWHKHDYFCKNGKSLSVKVTNKLNIGGLMTKKCIEVRDLGDKE